MHNHHGHEHHEHPIKPSEKGHSGHEPMSHRHMGHGGKGSSHGHMDHHAHMIADFRKRFWISLILTVPILLLSPMIREFLGIGKTLSFPGSGYLLLAFSTVVYIYGGMPFLKGLVDELRKRLPGMMTLIAVAITVAFVYSAVVTLGVNGKILFWELATLIDIMLLGHWIEMKSVMGASMALEALVKLMPQTAHLLSDDGSTRDVPVDSLKVDDKFIVKPGEKLPLDGVVEDGHSGVNESLLTGESKPVHKMSGDNVIGGAINGSGSLTVRVTRVGEDTFLSRVVDMVRKAQESKSRTQDLANRAAMWLTIISISAGVVTVVSWLVFGRAFIESIGRDPASYSIERMVTVMVITCPHALGLAVPLVVAVSTALAAKNGLLLRDRAAFESARLVDAVVFDKTGTLTEGKFGVQDIIKYGDTDENEIVKLAASVESLSEHPIASGITGEAEKRGIKMTHVDNFEAMKGKGVMGEIDGRKIAVVSAGYLEENSIHIDDTSLKPGLDKGYTPVFVIRDNVPLGAILLGDVIRDESGKAVEALHAMGIKCIMLTGDRKEVARAVASTLGLDEYFAEVLPDKKADKIRELMNRGMRVAMTGDGVNDAPALATADVGIAIGAGTDVAIETADIILVKSNPADVVNIFKLARATYRKMLQNLFWATGYNVIAIPLAAGVLASYGIILSPAVGAILMSASTVIVAINARFISID